MKYGDWTLGETEAILNIIGGVDVARAVLRGERKLVVEDVSLLTLTGFIKIRPVANFVASNFFKVSFKNYAPAPVKISYVGNSFKTWFLPSKALGNAAMSLVDELSCYMPSVVSSATEVTLRYHTLNRRSVDGFIIAELGGEAKAESSLAQIAECMKQQLNGKNGVLLTNDYANIFYVRDVNGILRSVRVCSGVDGWLLHADSVEDPCEWSAGRRVFSCDS